MTTSNADGLADRRTLISWAAFAVAIAICIHQRHFTLSLAHPETFRVMLHHRCGDLLAATALWTTIESLLALQRRLGPVTRVTA